LALLVLVRDSKARAEHVLHARAAPQLLPAGHQSRYAAAPARRQRLLVFQVVPFFMIPDGDRVRHARPYAGRTAVASLPLAGPPADDGLRDTLLLEHNPKTKHELQRTVKWG
jgi:hypothetical protein